MKIVNPKIPHEMKDVYNNFNIILKINLENIKKNYNSLKKLAPLSTIGACVKADAYGLGMSEICKKLFSLKCKDFFVATIEEAIFLRERYKKINIYLLNGINDLNNFIKIKDLNIIPVVNNMYQFKILREAFKINKVKIDSCLHIDSGMNRLGFSFQVYENNINTFKKYMCIKLVMSHMINSEKNNPTNILQLKKFKKIKEVFIQSNQEKFSLGNSNATFLGGKFHFDMIRAGGFIYGLDLSKKYKSKNVLSLKAKIIQLSNVKRGKSIGYGANYITKKNSIIATLAIGYADGLPRNYKGYGFLKNKKVKFVGNISMDLSCVDVTNNKKAKINDWVEIFGNNISIFDFAISCNTIPYEITSKIGPRVKRIYNI